MANKKSTKTKNTKFKILETQQEKDNRLFTEFFLFHLNSFQRTENLYYIENKKRNKNVNSLNYNFGKIYKKEYIEKEFNFCLKTLLYNENHIDNFETFCDKNKIFFNL